MTRLILAFRAACHMRQARRLMERANAALDAGDVPRSKQLALEATRILQP